jgi:serine/threonine-protein kinase
VVIATIVILAAIGTLGLWRRGTGDGSADAASVAVLPFVDLTPNQANAYLGDGIAETLINALANTPGVEVVARTSAFSFRGADEDIRDIGRQLGVANVLEGSVQRIGERLRVTAQLVKASDGRHLWSQNFDRDAGDIFAMQDEVAQAVVRALQGELLDDQVGSSSGTTNPAAYDAYLQGRFFWNKRAAPDLRQAIVLFEEAIALDSSFAEAWAGLADVYLTMPFYSVVASGEVVPRAKEAAEHALGLNPDLAEAHATLAYAFTIYDWDWTAAEREFQRAIELNPGYATAHKWYSDLLRALGRNEEALAAARRAAELDPRSPNVRTIVAITLWIMNREDDALVEFGRALELDPNFPLTLMHASRLFWLRGDTAQFFAAVERLETMSEGGGVSASVLRDAYTAGGPDSVLRLEVGSPAAQRGRVDRARVHILLGDLDAAFRELDQAVEERNVWLPFSIIYPEMAPLRDDPRYGVLLGRMGLE